MKRTNRRLQTGVVLTFLVSAGLLLLFMYASDSSQSRSKGRMQENEAREQAEREQNKLFKKDNVEEQERMIPAAEQQGDGTLEARSVDLATTRPVAFRGDVRSLTPVETNLEQRNIDLEEQMRSPETQIGPPDRSGSGRIPNVPIITAPMPSAIRSFEGMARLDAVTGGFAGAGFPPDTNGDVGRNYYIQSVNDAYAIYDKSNGNLLASFTENTLFAAGPTGTLCDTNTFGDPEVVYDQIADRWILSNLAFVANATTGLWDPPIYQCIAASRTNNPVSGGWNLYAVRVDDGTTVPTNTLDDYPKFGNWNDGCLYMGSNGFSGSTGSFTGPIFFSLNKSDMYAGLTLRGAVARIASTANANFGLFPASVLGTGLMPPASTPGYFVNNASTTTFNIRKFTPGANCAGGGTLAAAVTASHTSSASVSSNIVPQPNDTGSTHNLDSLGDRIMQKVQYRNIGGTESLWVVHTGRPGALNTQPQWAQINVTGATINTTLVQQAFHAPDTTLYRWMSAVGVDKDGNMAIGYSTSNGTAPNFPSLAYAGRLSTDPVNTLPQTQTSLIAGGGSALFNCGSGACHRWGDYASMGIDPTDECTFWFTSEYVDTQANGDPAQRNWHTRVGSFKFPTCTPSCVSIPHIKVSEFDGGTKSNVVVWQGATTTDWVMLDNSNMPQILAHWGASSLGDIAVPGDYDGDGKTDAAVWRPSDTNWYIQKSSGGNIAQGWGNPNDIPVVGDYDGDGKNDYAVWRPSDGNWYVMKSGGGTTIQNWGTNGDKPVPADYDNDGRTDLAVYRPSEGNWYVLKSSTGSLIVQSWGLPGDKLVPADYDGDGRADFAVYRPSEGNWYIIKSCSGSVTVQNWGVSSDKPVPADFDGDGKADIAVWRPSDANWYIIKSSGGVSIRFLGGATDTPVPNAYLPQ
jgi:hypothetical protein